MASNDYKPIYTGGKRSVPIGGFLVLLVGLAPFSIALATFLGLGLEAGLEAPAAWTGAAALVGVPVLGTASLLGRSVSAHALATWLWSCLLLIGLPYYLPGARGPAMERGINELSAPLTPELALSLEVVGEATERLLGGREAPPATPLDQWKASSQDKKDEDNGNKPEQENGSKEIRGSQPSESDEERDRVLAFMGEPPGMQVEVTVSGPNGEYDVPFLFDTGATLTTLSPQALARLGVPVPPSAPRAQLTTANGVIETPVVLVNAVEIDGLRLERVSVAACESCAGGEVEGLLGLNVTGRFDLTLRPEEREVVLSPIEAGRDQHLDIAHWLDLSSTATAWRSGRIEVEVHIVNRAPHEIGEAVIEVACPERSFAVSVSEIPAKTSRKESVSLPRGTNCQSYRIALRSARW